MAKTFIDELVEAPVKVLQKIGTDETIVQLLTNNPNIDMSSDEADAVFDRYLFDYAYVDDTTDQAEAYICVEVEIPNMFSPTFRDVVLYITVLCHKRYMPIDTSKFKGMIGNRRENLVRYIDRVISGSDLFGVGQLALTSITNIPAPAGFTARELVYQVPSFHTKNTRR